MFTVVPIAVIVITPLFGPPQVFGRSLTLLRNQLGACVIHTLVTVVVNEGEFVAVQEPF